VVLAHQLAVSRDEIAQIQADYSKVKDCAVVVLRMCMSRSVDRKFKGELERALRAIGREDIVKSCLSNVYGLHTVSDAQEKAAGRVYLDRGLHYSLLKNLKLGI